MYGFSFWVNDRPGVCIRAGLFLFASRPDRSHDSFAPHPFRQFLETFVAVEFAAGDTHR